MELLAMQRERDLAHNDLLSDLAAAVVVVANRIPVFSKDASPVRWDELRKAMPGWTKE